jgi:hypothetical protein
MKKILLTAVMYLSLHTAFAQITILRSDFGSIGDKVYTATVDTFIGNNRPTVGQSGANRNWNFSTFVPTFYDSVEFVSIAEFPDAPARANIGIRSGGEIEFYLLNDTFFKSFVQIDQTGDELEITNAAFPVTFGASGSDTITLDNKSTPAELGIPLPFDSIWITFNTIGTRAVDSWGQITLPNGTYDALRIATVSNTQITIRVKNDSQDWTPLPINLPGVGRQFSYIWMGKNSKYYLAEADADSAGNLLSLTYQVDRVFANSIKEINLSADVLVYPNPAKNKLQVELAETVGRFDYTVVDIMGREVAMGTDNQDRLQLDVSSLENGHYVILIKSDNGFARKIFSVQH